jgi:ABC-2 type transport system ATP-binding protein
MSQVTITNLTKKLKNKMILDDITFQFKPGTIYGLCGRNGSGKTMLLRSIAGLVYPTNGTITVDGKIMHKDISFPPSVGVIIENSSLLPQYDAFTNLKILSKIKKTATDNDIKESIKKVGLDPDNKLKVNKYSLGMKQRLSIAQAIFEKPSLLLLDEPTNALDEESVDLVRKILFEFRDIGATIIIASHNKDDLKILTDCTLKMNNGRMEIATNIDIP